MFRNGVRNRADVFRDGEDIVVLDNYGKEVFRKTVGAGVRPTAYRLYEYYSEL